MVVLHLFLVLERLRAQGARAGTLPRALIEAFVADMDDSLRELGTGDVAVAKKVRRAAAGFYERSGDYRAALAADDPQRARACARPAWARPRDASRRAARACRAMSARPRRALADQDGEDVLAGRIAFPAVTAIAEDAR